MGLDRFFMLFNPRNFGVKLRSLFFIGQKQFLKFIIKICLLLFFVMVVGKQYPIIMKPRLIN